MAAHQDRLQIHLQQEVHRGRLPNLAPAQQGETHTEQPAVLDVKRLTDSSVVPTQGEPCVMGQKQIYMKRRPGNYCMLGRDYSRILSAESCICRAHDFEW